MHMGISKIAQLSWAALVVCVFVPAPSTAVSGTDTGTYFPHYDSVLMLSCAYMYACAVAWPARYVLVPHHQLAVQVAIRRRWFHASSASPELEL
jgi:hypothetical protein